MKPRNLISMLVAIALLGAALPLSPASATVAITTSAMEVDFAPSTGAMLPNFAAEGDNLIRLLAGAFDPLADPLPAGAAIAHIVEETLPAGQPQYWLVQVNGQRYADAWAAIEATGGLVAGTVPDDTYMARATPEQARAIRADPAVRWVGYYQPAWRVPIAIDGKPGLLDLAGTQTLRVWVFRAEPNPETVGQALATMTGVKVIEDAVYVIDVEATAAQAPAIASISAVEWIGSKPEVVLLNGEARWVTDTGIRDVYATTAPGRLTGAGQTAAVADTGVNYTYDLNGRAHIAFRDCDPDGSNCKEAIYTQLQPGTGVANLTNIVNHGTAHRKMVAYFDLAGTGPNMFDPSSHGSHTGGSVTGDQGNNGVWDGHDGIAPGAKHVHQNIGTGTGGLAIPTDIYHLFRQAYRPRNPASVPTTSPPTGNQADYANYIALEDARTHNNSWGLIVQVVDTGNASAVDRFVWDHEDMLIVASAGNGGPGSFTIISPSLAKSNLSSGAMANGRQPMVSIDSMASFSSHGPTGDGRIGPDLATPGQVIVSVKGGTVDGYHVAQGTSMSGPILTGLSTLVRQYFYDGYGPASGSGFAGGAPDPSRSHNPSAALVKAALINGAERMRGFYTGDDGNLRALDGQWPSAGQGFGRVNLSNSLYFTDDPANNWYRDVWRSHADAFPASNAQHVRTYMLNVQPGAPFDVTLAWTDAPNLLAQGTPALVNNLDLEVVAPDGAVYAGNNMNSRAVPSVNVAETLPGALPKDVANPVERVRIASPMAGAWTIRVLGTKIMTGRQGFALAASGRIAPVGQTFTPGPGLQVDAPGVPQIDGVAVKPFSADTARVTFTTSEPTTAQAIVAGVTYIDSYNVGTDGFHGLNTGPVETSADYANRPVVGTRHEILLTGLEPGQSYTVELTAEDLGGNTTQISTAHTSPATVFQPDAPDIGQLTEGSTGGWRTGTQLYAGTNGGNGILGAFMFRVPENALDPNQITGAYVEMVSTHDWMIRYTQDPILSVDLLEESQELLWGTQTYEQIHNAAADARVYPETAHLRGARFGYAFTFNCADLQMLRNTLSAVDPLTGERRAAFRYESAPVAGTGLFAMDFGFNRRSNGPQLRPRLVLFTGNANPIGAACDPNTPAPSISNVGIFYEGLHGDGLVGNSVTVSWETDVAANSLVLFREQGTSDWIQVGSPALTRVHHVQVFGLDSSRDYEFVVRSEACNGATTTDTNSGEGYAFFVPGTEPVPTDDWFYHGLPTDQAMKAAGPPYDATFNQTPPAFGDTPTSQQMTGVANMSFVANPLAAFWVGNFSGTISGDVEFRLHVSSENPVAAAFGEIIEVNVFADPDLLGDPVQPDKIIGSGTIVVPPTSPIPIEVVGTIPVNGAVTAQMLIQMDATFIDSGPGLTIYYNSDLTPSGFGIPLGDSGGPSEELPLTGPVPPPSARATNLEAPPTRTGPATEADIAAGTGMCSIGETTPPPGANKTTGGGWLQTNEGKKINFGFNVEETADGLTGDLQLNDKAAGVKIHITDVTSIGDVGTGCGSVPDQANSLEFQGSGTYNGSAATFRVCVQDNGEPGNSNSSSTPDLFYLECISDCTYSTGSQTSDDAIDGGNIDVQRAADGDDPSEPSASTMILDPVLLSEGLAGQVQLFTVTVYDQNQDVLANATVMLTRTAGDGSMTTLTAVTDLTGTAVFSTLNLSQVAEYIATSGGVQSNTVEVSPRLSVPN
ncbi:MAG TPA: S8 family serine peptidase [Anaerolineae bacterium]|nr:S8 family serine peptidase [Anaerolineae bacterium]